MVLVAELAFEIVCKVVGEKDVGQDRPLRKMRRWCSAEVEIETCCLMEKGSMSCSFEIEKACVCAG